MTDAVERKMIARHPHVYGDADEPPDWERLKAEERAAAAESDGTGTFDDPLDGVPRGLEPLSRALRVQERAAGLGLDWPDATGAIDKLHEEIEELAARLEPAASPSSGGQPPAPGVVEEAGDLLFAAVNVCRLAGAHPLVALGGATEKFGRRLRAVVRRAREEGVELESAGPARLDELWEAVKRDEP